MNKSACVILVLIVSSYLKVLPLLKLRRSVTDSIVMMRMKV